MSTGSRFFEEGSAAAMLLAAARKSEGPVMRGAKAEVRVGCWQKYDSHLHLHQGSCLFDRDHDFIRANHVEPRPRRQLNCARVLAEPANLQPQAGISLS